MLLDERERSVEDREECLERHLDEEVEEEHEDVDAREPYAEPAARAHYRKDEEPPDKAERARLLGIRLPTPCS